ncbi:MAG: pyridoxal 5'-phosphate synthase glutaminase subunit PdxT [Piscirickettsiaceae bacterium]|nr:pyridoxal 5'-phosphate synthase glutaminase subunit PdxT [Piscirickettsiaceae bacterium]
MKIGLLALQGNYQKHSQILSQLGMQSVLIRYPQQLDHVSGLIIPGGESTTMSKLIDASEFRQAILAFAQRSPILGTCAGLIMMAKLQQDDSRINTLAIMNVTVTRNAFGRQLNSFVDDLTVNLADHQQTIVASFIRAPQINTVGPDVEVLARYNNDPVAVRQGRHIGLTFHPELNDVTLFHQLAFGGNLN